MLMHSSDLSELFATDSKLIDPKFAFLEHCEVCKLYKI